MEVKLYQGLIELNWNLPLQLLTVVVLILLLRKFFFRKIHDFMESREKEVRDSLDNAEKTNEEADARLAEYNAQLETAEDRKQEIIRDGREAAEKQAAAILADADKRVREKFAKADREIERDKIQAKEDVEKEMNDLVISAASRVLGETIDEEKQAELIERVIRETEDGNAGEEGNSETR